MYIYMYIYIYISYSHTEEGTPVLGGTLNLGLQCSQMYTANKMCIHDLR